MGIYLQKESGEERRWYTGIENKWGTKWWV